MDKLSKGSCAQYHADAPLSYFRKIYFWKTPIADCGNGKNDCMDYTKWQQAWTGSRARPAVARRARSPERGAARRRSGGGPGSRRSPCSRRRSARSSLVYMAALVALFVSAFWTVDSFTGKLVHDWTTENFQTLWNDDLPDVALRTSRSPRS